MLKMILLLKWNSLRAQLQYPANFAIHVLGISMIGLVDILVILALTNAFQSIGGWGFWELGFMSSLWRMSHGIHHVLFLSFWGHSWLVGTGRFDRLLVRPVHPVIQIMASDLHLASIGELLPAVALFFITCPKVKVAWNLFNIAFLVIVVFSGAIIEWAGFLFFAAFDFWFVKAQSFQWIVSPFLFITTRYPTHIYGRTLSFIVTYVFPYAFMAYYPTHHFFQLDVEVFYGFFPYITPLVAIIALMVALAFWSIGLKHYQSTGT